MKKKRKRKKEKKKKKEMSGIKADQHSNMADAYISEKWRIIYINKYIYIYIYKNRLKSKGIRRVYILSTPYIYELIMGKLKQDNEPFRAKTCPSIFVIIKKEADSCWARTVS